MATENLLTVICAALLLYRGVTDQTQKSWVRAATFGLGILSIINLFSYLDRYIVSALKAYKSGERSHPSMRGIAASLNEDQMKALADYYGAPAK